MKKTILASLKALSAGVMTLCVASLSFVSCYDDSGLQNSVKNLGDRLAAVEQLTAQLETLKGQIEGLYTLHFKVDAEYQLMYTFDGVNYVATGITVDENSGTPTIEQDGDLIKISVGEQSFTLEKPEEIVFEIRAGKVNFASEETLTVKILTSGISDLSVMECPKGWYAYASSDSQIEITAPNAGDTEPTWDESYNEVPAKAAPDGYIKVHACGEDGKCLVGKISVAVSYYPLTVKVLGTNLEISSYSYFGISKKEDLEADATPLLNALAIASDYNSSDEDMEAAYEILDNWTNSGAGTYTVASVLGSEPEIGKDYIAWAISANMRPMPGQTPDFSLNALVKTYFSPYKLTVSEIESAKTAYNVSVSVETEGLDSYLMLYIPGSYLGSNDELEENIAGYKENIVYAYKSGQIYGKIHAENFSGSLSQVCEGTDMYMTEFAPDSPCLLLVMPLDGRAAGDYSVDDVQHYVYYTSSLTAGGSISPVVAEYTGEVANPYTEVYASVSVESDAWTSFYFTWMSEEAYTKLGGDNATEADLAEVLLENYGMEPRDIQFPKELKTDCEPGETKYLVCMFVDADGKYGNVEVFDVTSDEIAFNNDLNPSFEANNLVKNEDETYTLKNTKSLVFDVAANTGVAGYKYVYANTNYFNQYESKTAQEMAQIIVTSSQAVAAEIVENKITIGGHQYNNNYYLAILAYDADGKPAASAYIVEYNCAFAIDNVITDETALVGAPDIDFILPTEMGNKEDGYCYYESEDWGWGTDYIYRFGWTVTPAEGTKVWSVLVNTDSYSSAATRTDAENASAVLIGDYSFSYYGMELTSTEPVTKEREISHGSSEAVPECVVFMVWQDATEQYYFKKVSVDLSSLKDALDQAKAASTPSVGPLL